MSFALINTIARYEMKTLLRSWFFRIFAALVVLSLSIFNIAMNIEASNAPWTYRALAASIPYANLIILNLGQAIVAIFLASEFLKQDKKNDTIEVIYARSMSNGDYVLGKTLGILLVFFILNILVLFLGIAFSFLSGDTSLNVFSLLVYPLLISVPTLVFILGLSFFLMILLKNQAITFLILLGYIAVTVFYLSSKTYHIFDFIAYHVPMMYSSIAGFGNITEIILHRSIFFFAGIAFIFFTIYKLPRLPQSKTFEILPLIFAVLFFAISGLLLYSYVSLKQNNQSFKQQILTLNNKYSSHPMVSITHCDLDVIHSGETISVNATLNIQNQSTHDIDTIILSLNPKLTITSLKIENNSVPFIRNQHLIFIPYKKTLKSSDSIQINLVYDGSIEENICFIDRNEENYSDNFILEMLNVRKRYAFVQKNFVCLTHESQWYPLAGAGYATNKPMVYFHDFTNFVLKVKTANGLTAISQGKTSKLKNGEFLFQPETPLTKICLVIGNYQRKSITVDSIEYSIFSIKGNQYYESFFKNIGDTISSVIKGLKQEYEVQTKLKYPFQRFSFVEVPVLFTVDKHVYSLSSDAIQPEMVLYPEKGVLLEESDFKKRKNRTEKDMKRNNEEILPEELQTRMFQKFIRANFTTIPKAWINYKNIKDADTYTLLPQLSSFVTELKSDKWPILFFAFEGWLKKNAGGISSSSGWFYEGMTKAEKINVELKQASLQNILIRGIENKTNERNPIYVKDVILDKGIQLFNIWSARFGEKEFNTTIYEMLSQNRFKSLPFPTLDSVIQSKFGGLMQPDIQNWFLQQKLPGFIIKDLVTYKIIQKEATKYQIRFKIANPESVDGLFTLVIEMNDAKRDNSKDWYSSDEIKPDYSKSIYIPANSAREIGISFTSLPLRMAVNTNVSENLPNVLKFDFKSFSETKKVPELDTIIEIPVFSNTEKTTDVIVDNEDGGFSLMEDENQAFLKSVFYKKENRKYNYFAMRFWDMPSRWVPVLETRFYGKYVHSAYYTKAGSGNRKAIWKANLNQSGFYDVYFYYTNIDTDWKEQKTIENYQISVFHDGGVEKVKILSNEMDNGWNFLGSFYISKGNAKVELTNKTGGEIVFADAIKWVKVN